jgi:peptidoglycan/LPS O-acetylase OafA/YrhL
VVIFHFGHDEPFFPASLTHFGYEAVTFFFVLSGFILTYVHIEAGPPQRLNVTAREFLISRIARIAPAYLAGLALAAPFFFYSALKLDTSLFIAGVVLVPFMAQAWYPPAALLWNLPAWSLSNELLFYAAYPILWRTLGKMAGGTILFLAFGAIVLVEAFRGLLADLDSVAWHNFRAYFPLLNLPQFVFGIGLAGIFISGRALPPTTHEKLLWASLAALGMIIAFKNSVPWLGSTPIISVVFGCIIFGASGGSGFLTRALSAKPLVMLGEASYAIYIIHIPIWLWWYRVNRVNLRPDMHPIVEFACYFALVICASFALLFFVERPARGWMRQIRYACNGSTRKAR